MLRACGSAVDDGPLWTLPDEADIAQFDLAAQPGPNCGDVRPEAVPQGEQRMNSASGSPDNPGQEATAAHLRRVLRGFSPEFDVAQHGTSGFSTKVPRSKVSLPVFAHQVMDTFGASPLGRGDKVAWRYGFTVDGVQCVLESARSGLGGLCKTLQDAQ